MQVKCFECGVLLSAPDPDAVAEVFTAHARLEHSWSYPEDAIRCYARNYAEAGERLSGSTQRVAAISEVSVQPVTGERVDDWLDFFDRDGFAGNPGWASCYCLEPHVPTTPEQPERPWRQTRAASAERLRQGTTFGYLAYVAQRAVGWVNASLASEYGALYQLRDRDRQQARSVIGVSCFVIAPAFRRHGVASRLLDQIITDAPGRGAAWIEAYPHNSPKPGDADHFRGPRSMFEARGFQPVAVLESHTVLRRPAT